MLNTETVAVLLIQSAVNYNITSCLFLHRPKDKYIHLTRDSHYQSDKHQLSSTPASAEAACSYDLDATDTSWLNLLNAERARAGAAPITEEQLEKVIEELEVSIFYSCGSCWWIESFQYISVIERKSIHQHGPKLVRSGQVRSGEVIWVCS